MKPGEAVSVPHLQPGDLADAQVGAVADAEQHAHLQIAHHHQKPLRLVGAEDLRDFLRQAANGLQAKM